jgi:hypothetical protein
MLLCIYIYRMRKFTEKTSRENCKSPWKNYPFYCGKALEKPFCGKLASLPLMYLVTVFQSIPKRFPRGFPDFFVEKRVFQNICITKRLNCNIVYNCLLLYTAKKDCIQL